MTRLLTIAALAVSLSGGVAFAQDSSGSSDGSSGEGASGTTNAPNAPFLGNRDVVGGFYSDEGMTTLREGDEFTSAYNALTEEQRAGITAECASDNGQNRPFCDAFTAAGSN